MKSIEMCMIVVGAIFCLASCTKNEVTDIESTVKEETSASGTTEVTFEIAGQGVKSSLNPEEDKIRNLAIIIFRDGTLESYGYTEGEERLTLELLEGKSYNIYATANTGEPHSPIPEKESDFLNIQTLLTYDITGLGKYLPMCWSRKGVKVTGTLLSIEMEMERLVAKIHFSVNKELLKGLEVTAVRLCQGATALYPFRWETGNRATEEDGTADGDYASAKDLANLNNGEEIVFYALENCQGNLLPDNTDPWAKVPENLENRGEYCTYLEVECSFLDGHLLEGDVTYRFYAGADNCRNFDIRRNTEQHISLTLSQDGLYKVSWMVEQEINVRDGYASGYLIEGNHPVSGMYAGEVIRYGAILSDELAELLGDDINDCRIIFEPDGTGGMIEFGGLEVEDSGTNTYSAEGTAFLPGTGKLALTSAGKGRIATLAANVNILAPRIAVSSRTSVGDNEKNFSLTDATLCTVNGSDAVHNIYLVDRDGYNLNKSGGSGGFNLGVFDFRQTGINGFSSKSGQDNFSVIMEPGVPRSGGPAVTYTAQCSNDGLDPEANDGLTEIFQNNMSLSFDVNEGNLGLSERIEFDIDVPGVLLTLVDNGWAGYHGTQMSLVVDNPSKLPLDIIFWQFMSSGIEWKGSGYDSNETWLTGNVTIDEFCYIGTDYAPSTSVNGKTDWKNVCTGGRAEAIRAENNSRGTPHLTSGDKMIFPVKGVNSEALRKTLVHYRLENNEMYNMFQVSPEMFYVRTDDRLSDGTMTYETIYGAGGFNDQGAFEGGIRYFSNMSAAKLENLNRKHRSGDFRLSIRIDTSGNIYAKSSSGTLTLSFKVSGTANGYVYTYPNGTWKKGQDNYCTASGYSYTEAIQVSPSETLIDSKTVSSIFSKIYSQTFFDSYNKLGSANNYQHSAHPTSLALEITAKLSGTDISQNYMPVTISFSGDSISYYHIQEGTTYPVSTSSSFPTMKFANSTIKY